MILWLLACSGGLDFAVPDGWTAVGDAMSGRMQRKLELGVAELALPGAAMGFADAPESKLWVGAAGLADVASEQPWGPEDTFHIGSVTKTFTAALVLQLDSEGVLSLDDSLEDWVPGYFDEQGVTLEHLLAHTSGIASYNYVGSFDDSVPWTPEELVDWAVSVEPELRFEPGSDWEYSNTNFVLLGLVIEAALEVSYEEALQQRLLDPLGLEHTYLAGSGNEDAALVSTYDTDGEPLTGSMDPSMGWAAGALVSTPAELAIWGAALYGGEVLEDEALERMVTQQVLADGTVVEHGLGAFVETDGVDALYGHTGGYEGYQTYLYYWEADGMALAVMSSQAGTDLRTLAGYGWAVPLGLSWP